MKKILIISVVALLTATPLVNATSVDKTKITQFSANTQAVASEVNGNFNAQTSAINDNFNKITAHVNDGVAHGGGGLGAAIGGDGSSVKDLIVNASINWGAKTTAGVSNSPDNFNWLNCNIGGTANAATPVVLTVPSGTTIRCQSGFTLQAGAKIVVSAGYGSGFTLKRGIPLAAVKSSLHSFPLGGAGDDSGGYIRIQSNGTITINGSIVANGNNGVMQGNPAGGGGVIIIESSTNISLDAVATIAANGGVGAGSKNVGYQTDLSPSGGGGGGIVALVAPVVQTSSATITAKGGGTTGRGDNQSSVIGNRGKSSGGTGGVPYGYLSTNATPGTDGHVITMIGNPATMVP